PAGHVAVDRDAVVVVERDELAETKMPGQRAHFLGDALHHAAVAEKHVRVMIDDAMAFAVEARGEHFFRERHPDRVAQSLPERSGRRLDAGRAAVLGMARRLRMELAKI